jgi:hypothetical protein
VHFTTFEIEDEDEAVLATNQFRLMPTNVKNRLLTPAVLQAMSHDSRVISGMMAVAEAENKQPGSTGKIPSEMNEKQPPWHYKPPSQGNPRPKVSDRSVGKSEGQKGHERQPP